MPEVILSDYFYGQESEEFIYFKIPRLLITDQKFKHVSTDAKLLYGMLLDRMGLSAKNGWYDELGRVYIYYTVDEICEDMCCGRDKAMKLLAELDQKKGIGLVERVKQGQGRPTKLYIKRFTTRTAPPEPVPPPPDHFTPCSEVEKNHPKTSEKSMSRGREKPPQEVEKIDPNHTKGNQTDLNHPDPSILPPKPPGGAMGMDRYELREEVKANKIIPIHRRLDHCVDYALNEEKTGLGHALDYGADPAKARLVTGINCGSDCAYRDMQATKRRWDKRGGILGYHIIHSYAPGEATPEQAHAAGVEFARRLLGERYEAVVCTHTDREHLHCHIVFNSVSFLDGRKYRSDFASYFDTLRNTSNEVSREFGLSVIEPDGHGKHYAQWDAERTGRGDISRFIRQDIDAALRESFTFEGFLAVLRRQGYTVKHGPNIKHTAVAPPGAGRNFRLDSLGAFYACHRLPYGLCSRSHCPASPRPEMEYTGGFGRMRN